ncbi:unnamed protein product [Microthlaspi erraticum]|uniref:Stress up-regulated Nod 19 protein n=1 Tax=Microthlaspi erraticum TaxID=1685480 RepID=A0A6D2J5C8_9BRAS|nr:unnamed protein product [Microthlaspi erraticum]
MARYLGTSLVLLVMALTTISPSHGFLGTEKKVKSAVFLSQKLEMNPGSVINSFFYDMDFPRGHIGVKSFDAEVVDESGNSVPLHETYLHHWAVVPYYQRKGFKLSPRDMPRNLVVGSKQDPDRNLVLGSRSNIIIVNNAGLCNTAVRPFFGKGSETRKTSTYAPDPYAIEFDNPEERPDGYELKWLLNIHAIDTRGVVDKSGCTECRCDLYNVTIDEYGRTIKPDYQGGLNCCYHKTQCRVRNGFDNGDKTRSLYLKYTVGWVDWDSSVVPVKVYSLDITDTWERKEGSTGDIHEHDCPVEYNVKPCKTNGDGCVDVKKKSFMMPFDGYVVFGVVHQHAGGLGGALYREDGEGIFTSMPEYGNGVEPGNEAGYIVGISSCYPQEPVKVSYGETLTFESNYSNAVGHTGVMGIFHLLVAQQLHEPEISLPALFQVKAAVVYRRQNREDGYHYQSLST